MGKYAEAARRFRGLLDLKLGDDEPGLAGSPPRPQVVGATATGTGTGTGNSRGRQGWVNSRFPIQSRIAAAWQVRAATRLDPDPLYFSGPGTGMTSIWTPPEFGQARMAAIAWLYAIAGRDDKQAEMIRSFRESCDRAKGDPRPHWGLVLPPARQGRGDGHLRGRPRPRPGAPRGPLGELRLPRIPAGARPRAGQRPGQPGRGRRGRRRCRPRRSTSPWPPTATSASSSPTWSPTA